jgi:aspartate/methionine/tyrosine aminotransferase
MRQVNKGNTSMQGGANALNERLRGLSVDTAPGQEVRQKVDGVDLRGEKLRGIPVDFSHGDVNAFAPVRDSLDAFVEGFYVGGAQAYTEYRGKHTIREELAEKLANFTGAPIDADRELILTSGTQGALFLAAGSCIHRDDKVAIVEPDYFANRKLVRFFGGQLVPVPIDYLGTEQGAGINFERLEACFRSGVKVFIFSNPNNPTGGVYSHAEVTAIAHLAQKYNVVVIVDQLYSRQIFEGCEYTHLRGLGLMAAENLLTIIGPSKTESLSGFRLGAAFGSSHMIDRMEELQAIVCLRAAGYSQAVLATWFSEPPGWLQQRIAQHQAIRDDLYEAFTSAEGFNVRLPEGGSYLFPQIPDLDISITAFARALRTLADVTVTPGTEFGPQFTNSFRINFSQDPRTACAAVDRILEIADRYRTRS